MKKNYLGFIALAIVKVFVFNLDPTPVKAGKTYLKEIEATIVYGTTGEGGVEIAGVEIPVGLTGSFGTDPIGVFEKLLLGFSYL
ncbi:hypothetical protein [Algoriphagus sp. CAU 1675]|uniref:hypothetical protein n=1 Tax=Algoriphagus sp. CAU 1675 TaxID=3032597 RepID=UPI0023DBD31A|nr:hypothetical protein [Algoriphagus sp. CAU 1675]MDF2156758.1 hypothetical protein [Algoriphagus sp. CAU 1675]